MNVNIQIKNLPQLRAAFRAAPRIMGDNFRKALTKSAVLVKSQSMIRTPVLTGRLRASHEFKVTGLGLRMEAEIGPTAFYGVFVHEGTRFMKGRPFLKQGAEASLQQIQDFFTDATQDGFNRIGRMT